MQTLSQQEKDFLLFLFNNNEAMIDLRDPEVKKVAKSLVASGMLDRKRPAFTNRGICHLVVECKVPFSAVRCDFPKEYASADEEIALVRKYFDDSDEAVSIYFYHKYNQMIAWDLFDQSGTYRHMDPEQLRKFSFAVFERMVEDERLPIEKTLRMYGIPESLIKERHVDKAMMKIVFQYLRQ